MKNCLFIITAALFNLSIYAQNPSNKSFSVSIGYAVSAPYENVDIYSTGILLQAEYVVDIAKWIDNRSYIGFAGTAKAHEDQIARTYAKAGLIGNKFRIKAPFPWVSPYVEGGVGASLGVFQTQTFVKNIEKEGVLFHIPFSLGLELGPTHNVDAALTYYFHPGAEQFVGAVAIGLNFPIN